MNLLLKLFRKLDGYNDLQKEKDDLQKDLNDRDIILKRIKIIATSNHYGYSKEDMEYREKNCINVKLKKIFELASEFDKNNELDFWDKLNEEDDK
jgi:hypothetical protein